jgi:4-carboxymuconolactone decarboxylase
MQREENRYERGLATMRTMFGLGIDSALNSLEATSPGLARYLVEFPFANVYTHPGLDLKTREMLTVAALTVLGYPQAELKDHIRGALNVGCTPDQILEIILQMAIYFGFPAALEAVKTAASVIRRAKSHQPLIQVVAVQTESSTSLIQKMRSRILLGQRIGIDAAPH